MKPIGPTVSAALAALAAIGLLVLATVATLVPLSREVSPVVVALTWLALLGIAVLEQVLAGRRTAAAASADSASLAETVRLEVADLAAALSVDPPAVSVLESDAPLVGVTALPGVSRLLVSEGFLEAVDDDERRAIFAHELAHVAGRDGLAIAAGAATANAVGLAVFWWWALSWTSPRTQLLGVVAYECCYLARSVTRLALATVALAGFLPLVAVALVRAVSRWQEFRADAVASRRLGDPRPLVRGLGTLGVHARTVDVNGSLRWEGPDATDKGERGRLEPLLATHPPFDRRVDRLLERDRR